MLKGKHALVTGSTSGIGLAIARALAAQGASLTINGLGERDEIERIRSGLASEFGVEVNYQGADLSRPAEIETMMKAIPRVDILVNNAGIQYVANVVDFPPERWDAIIAINLSSAFHTSRLAVPGMLERNWGRVINIASAHGLVASAGKSAYVSAKHGIVGFTKTLALETARTGVTCNAICPGWVLTGLVQKQIDARAKSEGISPEQAKIELVSEKQPSQAFVTPEQLGGLAVFLCSPAADQVRGAAWNIDGGWVAQ